MKKIKYFLFALLLLPLGLFLGACGQGAKYTINFIVDNEIYHSETIEDIEELKIPENPAKDGYLFDGWYLDDQTFETLLSKDLELKEDLNVYAKWTVCEHSNIVQDALRPATWTNNGLTAGSHCGDCGHVIVQQTTIVSPQISFTNETFTYDGEEHSIYISGDLLANVSVEYTNNSKTNGGTYDVVASFTSSDGYYNLSDLHATMTIVDAEVTNVTSLSMNNGILSWDGDSPYGYKIICNGQEIIQREKTFDNFLSNDYNSVKVAVVFKDGTIGEYVELNDFVVNAPVSNIHFTDDGTTVQFTWDSPNDLYDYVFMINGVKTTIDKSQHLYNVQRAQLKANDKIGIYVVGVESLNYFDSKVEEITLQQLDTPIIRINKLNLEWDAINGAGNYKFTFTGSSYTTITETFISCEDRPACENTIKLVAYGTDVLCSEQNTTTFTKLHKPTISITDGIATWEAIAGQLRYVVEIDGNVNSFAANQYTLENRNTQWSALLYAESRASNIMQSDYVYIENDVLKEGIYTAFYGNFVGGEKEIKSAESKAVLYIPLEYGDADISYNTAYSEISLYTYLIPSNLQKIKIKRVHFIEGTSSIVASSLYNCTNLIELTIPNSVTSIGNRAFSGCTGLTEIVIPDSVTSIGNFAFYNCTGLTEIIIPNSVTSIGDRAFLNCTGVKNLITSYLTAGSSSAPGELISCFANLERVELLGNVTTIPSHAFSNCTSLTEIVIPNSVTSIGDSAFYNCTGLTKINITDLSKWCEIDFANGNTNPLKFGALLYLNNEIITKTTIPEGTTKIGNYAFCGWIELTEVIIPESVISISDHAFYGCTGLTEVVIPDSVTNIGEYAFSNCTSLTEITIPDSVTSIGEKAFYGCTGLTEVIIPESVISISDHAFYGCTGLTEVVIPDSVTNIGRFAFYNCTRLTKIVIPDSVTSIGDSAFYNCTGLTKINITDLSKWCEIDFANGNTNPLYYAKHLYLNDVEITELDIPEGTTEIKPYVFKNCESFVSVNIPDSVTNIGAYAFSGCTGVEYLVTGYLTAGSSSAPGELISCFANLERVELLGNVTTIPNDAFYNCTGLTEIVIPNSVTNIGNRAFYGCTGLTEITIPGSVTSMGSYAFEGCTGVECLVTGYLTAGSSSVSGDPIKYFTSLKRVELLDNITTIPNYAFRNCTGLTEIIIPDSVTSIGNRAFYGCTGLTEIVIPDSVTTIGDSAFYNCTGLTKINITDLSKWCEIDFANGITNPLYYAKHLYLNDVEITELDIPEGTTEIKPYAFYYCESFVSVNIPSSVTRIGNSAFYNCTGLTKVNITDLRKWCEIVFYYNIAEDTDSSANPLDYAKHLYLNDVEITELDIPEGTTEINPYAFSNCTSLTEIVIPNSVTSIGGSAFSGCTGLTKVNITDLRKWCEIDFGIKYKYDFGSADANPLCYAKHLYLNDVEITELEIPDGITEIKPYAFYSCAGITKITIPDGVKSIDVRAFYNCTGVEKLITGCLKVYSNGTISNLMELISCLTNLKRVKFLSNITTIPSNALSNCTELTEITIPASVISIGEKAFYNCIGLTEIIIPDSVTSIGDYAFSGCTSLTEIIIPASVTSIGKGALKGCENLVNLTLPFVGSSNSVSQHIGNTESNYLFGYIFGCTTNKDQHSYTTSSNSRPRNSETLTYQGQNYLERDAYSDGTYRFYYVMYYIPQTLRNVTIINATGISANAFYGCSYLTSITLNEGITTVNASAFNGCTGLTEITIPDSVTSIGSGAFGGCTGLAEITIPDSVTGIGSDAFSSCTGLTEITIPDSVTSIGSGAFNGCTGLTRVNITDLSKWFEIDFGSGNANPLYCAKHLYLNDVEITELEIPDGITEIKPYAFYFCAGITKITIPDGVKRIGDYAFYYCTRLTEITIPNSVTRIDNYAFSGSGPIKEIIIPESVSIVGCLAFGRGTEKIYCEHTTALPGWGELGAWHYDSTTIYLYRQEQPTETGNYWHYDEDGVTPLIW